MSTQRSAIDTDDGQSGEALGAPTNNQLTWSDWFTLCLHWLRNPLSTILIGISWLVNLLSVVIIGAGIGWLLGLSVSPVVASIVAVVIAAAATLVAVMGGWEKDEDKANKSESSGSENGGEDAAAPIHDASTQNVNGQRAQQQTILTRFTRVITPIPFALLMVGIVAGSIVGLYARNHSWFGSNFSSEVEKWTAQGLSKDEVVRRLFEREYPYTPYVQPWLRITNTMPISSAIPLTVAQIAVSPPISAEVKVWEDLGLDRTWVISRFFELKYPVSVVIQSSLASNSETTSVIEKNNTAETVLFALTITDCDLVTQAIDNPNDASMKNQIRATGLISLTDIIDDAKMLRKVLEVLCLPS